MSLPPIQRLVDGRVRGSPLHLTHSVIGYLQGELGRHGQLPHTTLHSTGCGQKVRPSLQVVTLVFSCRIRGAKLRLRMRRGYQLRSHRLIAASRNQWHRGIPSQDVGTPPRGPSGHIFTCTNAPIPVSQDRND